MLRQQATWWFPWAVAALHAADVFILVVPNDVLLVAAVLAHRQRWAAIAVLQTAGCLLGCAALCAVALYDPHGLKHMYPSVFESDSWQQTEELMHEHGLWAALVLGSVFPVHPFLFVGALSGVSVPGLLASLTAGRLVRNLAVCFLAVRATEARVWLSRFKRAVGLGGAPPEDLAKSD